MAIWEALSSSIGTGPQEAVGCWENWGWPQRLCGQSGSVPGWGRATSSAGCTLEEEAVVGVVLPLRLQTLPKCHFVQGPQPSDCTVNSEPWFELPGSCLWCRPSLQTASQEKFHLAVQFFQYRLVVKNMDFGIGHAQAWNHPAKWGLAKCRKGVLVSLSFS